MHWHDVWQPAQDVGGENRVHVRPTAKCEKNGMGRVRAEI